MILLAPTTTALKLFNKNVQYVPYVSRIVLSAFQIGKTQGPPIKKVLLIWH